MDSSACGLTSIANCGAHYKREPLLRHPIQIPSHGRCRLYFIRIGQAVLQKLVGSCTTPSWGVADMATSNSSAITVCWESISPRSAPC